MLYIIFKESIYCMSQILEITYNLHILKITNFNSYVHKEPKSGTICEKFFRDIW